MPSDVLCLWNADPRNAWKFIDANIFAFITVSVCYHCPIFLSVFMWLALLWCMLFLLCLWSFYLCVLLFQILSVLVFESYLCCFNFFLLFLLTRTSSVLDALISESFCSHLLSSASLLLVGRRSYSCFFLLLFFVFLFGSASISSASGNGFPKCCYVPGESANLRD